MSLLIHSYVTTHSFICHYSFIHMSPLIHSYVTTHSFISAPALSCHPPQPECVCMRLCVLYSGLQCGGARELFRVDMARLGCMCLLAYSCICQHSPARERCRVYIHTCVGMYIRAQAHTRMSSSKRTHARTHDKTHLRGRAVEAKSLCERERERERKSKSER